MVKITMDYSAMILYDRHPEIERLKMLEEDGKLRLYDAHSLNRDLGTLTNTEEKIYDRLRHMVFGRAQQDISLADHGDLVLLVNHMKNKRDYFLTLDLKKYANLRGHRNLDVRFPDKAFLKEVENRLGIVSQPKAKKAEKVVKKAAKTRKATGKAGKSKKSVKK